MKEFAIYFKDLKPDVQKQLLDFYGLESESDGNFEFNELFTLEDEDEDDVDYDEAEEYLSEFEKATTLDEIKKLIRHAPSNTGTWRYQFETTIFPEGSACVVYNDDFEDLFVITGVYQEDEF